MNAAFWDRVTGTSLLIITGVIVLYAGYELLCAAEKDRQTRYYARAGQKAAAGVAAIALVALAAVVMLVR